MRRFIKHKAGRLTEIIELNWKVELLVVGIFAVIATVTIQFLYPSDLMLPHSRIDGIFFGARQKEEVIKTLDDKYKNQTVPIYFGSAKKPYISPKPDDFGMSISNAKRINNMVYPWYFRIIPGSILWYQLISDKELGSEYNTDETVLSMYIESELGDSCDVKPVNANLTVKDGKIEIVNSVTGGTCEVGAVRDLLSSAKPTFGTSSKITIPVDEISPAVSDDMARQYSDQLMDRIKNGVDLLVNGEPQNIPYDELIGWMDFSNADNKLGYSFSADRAGEYLGERLASKVYVAPGTTYVKTYNFIEISRTTGVSGKALDVAATLSNMKLFIDSEAETADVAASAVEPNVEYSRSYSPTDIGLSALMQQYAETHQGIFGVSMVELGGSNRRASYNDTKQFITASTYKLFVAYSTLKRVENDSWHWNDPDIASGRNLEECFDDMIAKSDNACAEALLAKVGFRNITNDAHDIGCNSTTFLESEGIKSTPADLALFLAELRTGQILNQQSSRDKLMDAMSRNIYREGIPEGLPGISVADKVGFLDGLLHDAAIVYSPTGNYIIVIMTEGSSWSAIADLATQIESLRNQ